MTCRLCIIGLVSIVCSTASFAQRNTVVTSPNGEIRFTFGLLHNKPEYAVMYKGEWLLTHSGIGLTFINNDSFGNTLKLLPAKVSDGTDDYTLPAGKTSKVHELYREINIPLQEQSGTKRLVYFHVKVYNDGLAFRYEFPKQNGWDNYILTNEQTQFNFTGNPIATVAFLENFTTSHEHRYTVLPVTNIANDTLMDMPALFEFPGKAFVAITEANLVNYAGMSLSKHKGILCSALSPLPGQELVKVKAILPHQTPWRVLLISKRSGALIESNIITNVANPSTIPDVSWLQPGKASFHWWNGDVLPDTNFEAGINFNFNKYYIDFCARNGIAFHTIIGNRGVAWYQNDGIEYQPGPNTDITKPRPGLDIQAICDYAHTKGVGIRFWVHWKALYPKIDTAFALFERWGIKGMMVDFMDRDDQEMVNIQEEILQKAAAHHLEIQFHGAFKPTGLSRTYPNESTREGTLNYENNKWDNLITPDDDINIPFTRLLAGPTDYHLGGFRAMPSAGFTSTVTKPHMLGTRCHMLAMYVVLENHLSMVCDYPEAYENQAGFSFIQQVPTVWDATVVPAAEKGQFVAISRRKGEDWFMGIINNSAKRRVNIPLYFLTPGKSYMVEIYKDAPDVELEPNHLVIEKKLVTSATILEVDLAAGGGAAYTFTAQ